MGLDALVYLNLDNLPIEISRDAVAVYESTGEIFFLDQEMEIKFPAEIFTACHRRLGNVSFLAEIAHELEPLLRPDSILRGRVLITFTHSGDVIGVDDLSALESEVCQIRERTTECGSQSLTEFLNDLEALIMAAKQQRNPIVFA